MTIKEKKLKELSIYIIPNLFTSCNLFCGFYAILSCINGNYVHAAMAIIVASIFDMLDGRIARMTKGYSRFGEEYDSLSDQISFVASPSILIFKWGLEPFGKLGWLASFLFIACWALRLARFNVQSHTVEKKHFQGLPTPVAAGVIATLVIMFNELGLEFEKSLPMLIMTFILSFLMISDVRYRSFKDFDLRHKRPFMTTVLGLMLFIVIVSKPEIMLFVLVFTYVTWGFLHYLFRLIWKKPSSKEEVEVEDLQ